MPLVILAGLAAPAAVLAVAGLAWISFGASAAIAVLVVGGAGLLAVHLWYLHQLTQWAQASLETPVPEGRGTWRIAFSALYRRVRARKAVQRDLADTIERFRSFAEAIPDGMIVLDAGNRIQWANVRALAHLGLDLAQDEGRPLLNLVRQPEVVRYLEGGDFTDAIIVDSQRAPGVTLSIQVIPFGVSEKLLISRDITRLESVARIRRDFIANVSHELKTPLTVVSGFLETLLELELDPRQRTRYLQMMREQAGSMERLVDDLLTLSALESEQNSLAELPIAIQPLLLEISAAAKVLSDGKHDVKLDLGPVAMVTGNRDELASAFNNLVSNAVRYTPAGGTITLAWRLAEENTGEFAVTDTGIGIAAEHIPRLTERFYRVDRSRSRATGGTGLGLAIVKHVLLRHQATLAITSEPGRGSTFAVRLPARRIEWVADIRASDAVAGIASLAPQEAASTSS